MSMLSTRGAAAVSESMAILRGLAPDGGLYVPKDFPHFSMEEIAALGALDYQARALAILQKFLPDFTADEMDSFIAKLIKSKADDGQFDECDISFRDLCTIKKSFLNTLKGYFHKRITYPGQKNGKDDENGSVQR